MANIDDVADADNSVQKALEELKEISTDETYFATVAVCNAITAFALRMDYVLRDLNKGHDWPTRKKHDYHGVGF